MNSSCRSDRLQRGMTLVELVVTIVILGIALVAVATMVHHGAQNSANVLLETRATALGQAYLDEILGRRFDERAALSGLQPCFGLAGDTPAPARPCTALADFGPDSGEQLPDCRRELFDDVDDYHSHAEGDGSGCSLRDAEGEERSDYENFRVDIAVRYAGNDAGWDWSLEPMDPAPDPAAVAHDTHAKLVTVTVTVRGQEQGWRFSAYRGNY